MKKLEIENYNDAKRLFFGFLKRKNAYTKWLRNFKKAKTTRNRKIYFHEMMKATLFREGINEAFSWTSTKEGFDFWAYLDAEWKKRFYNNQNQLNNSFTFSFLKKIHENKLIVVKNG